MNSTQKAFYRYKYEKNLPKLLRQDVKPVSIHKVINSKVLNSFYSMRGTCHLELSWLNEGFISVEDLVRIALSRQNIKLMRLCFKHYNKTFLSIASDIIPMNDLSVGITKEMYKPFLTFAGYKHALYEFKQRSKS